MSGRARPGDEPGAAPGFGWVVNSLLGELAGDPDIAWGSSLPAGHRPLWTFSLAPNAEDPYLLLPSDVIPAAQAAVHGLGNPLRSRDRALEAAVGIALRTRLPQRFAPTLYVSAPGPVAAHRTLLGHLATVVGRDDAVCAVILGRRRPNRKPVIKVLSQRGDVLAFAKVGWNDLTRELVRTEVRNLARIAAARPRTFRVPTVLEAGPWAGLELLVTSPIPPARRGEGPPLRMPGDATREIARLDGTDATTFASSSYRSDIRRRIRDGGADEVAPLLEAALAEVDTAWAGAEIPFGSWHGDWIPWNLLRADDQLFVWDWERAATGVPVGSDVAHFRFDVEAKVRRRSPSESARSSAEWTEHVAIGIGARPGSGRALALLNLMEMCLRFREGRGSGMPARDTTYVRGLRALMPSAPRTEA